MNPSGGAKASTATSAATFYGTIGVVLLLIAVLAFIDVRLAGVEEAEGRAEAERYFQEGQQFAKNGDYERAVERFRSAVGVERDNTRIQLALAQALFDDGRIEDASTAANRILDRDPTSADAALILARVRRQEGNVDEAASFYHRAVFNRWLDNADQRRVDTRLELADMLADNNRTEELLPELFALQDQATDNIQLKSRIGHLYVTAGAPERASELFAGIIKERPEDADAWAGSGEAEFALGNYRTARGKFETALKLNPESPDVLAELDLTDQVLMLDPLVRGVSSQERYERSRRLLEMAADSLKVCAGANPDYAVTAMAEQAQTELGRRIATSRRNEAVDKNLDLAEQVWTLRVQTCGQPSDSSGKAVDLVLTRVRQ